MKKIIVSSLAFLVLASCAEHKTNGKFLTEQKDAWMNGYAVEDDVKKANKGLVFCRANAKESGKAEPVCYNAKFE